MYISLRMLLTLKDTIILPILWMKELRYRVALPSMDGAGILTQAVWLEPAS